MRTVSIINQKGGCGKTTTAINLAACLAERRHRVVLIDLDPQSHCAAGLAVPEDRIDQDIGDAMLADDKGSLDPTRYLWRISFNLDLIPSRTKLAGLEAPRGPLSAMEQPQQALTVAVERLALADVYDVCIIDCPPSIGTLTYNALAASREVVIPVDTSYFSLLGAQKQVRTVRSLGRKIGMRHDSRLLPTIHDPKRRLARDLLDELRSAFEERVTNSVIHFDEAVPEAASFGRPLTEYATDARATEDYRSLAEWVLGRVETSRSGDPVPGVSANGVDDEAEDEALVGIAGWQVPRFSGERAGAVQAPAPRPAAEDRPPRGGWQTSQRPAASVVPSSSRADELLERTRAFSTKPALREPGYRVTAESGALQLIEEVRDELEEANGSRQRRGSVRRLFGSRVAGNRIVFVQPLELGSRVHVAGTFNGWDPERHPMRRNEELGIHELAIDVPPGRHEYRLVVDGQSMHDPHAAEETTDEAGRTSGVVRVGAPARQ